MVVVSVIGGLGQACGFCDSADANWYQSEIAQIAGLTPVLVPTQNPQREKPQA
jgi:hypothetical protein